MEEKKYRVWVEVEEYDEKTKSAFPFKETQCIFETDDLQELENFLDNIEYA